MKFVLLIFLYSFFSQGALGYATKKNSGEGDENTRLHLAIMAEDERGRNDERLKKTVQALLQGGSDPNVMNEKGMTPLYLSAGYEETFTLLLQYGADPNISDSNHKTDFLKIIKRMVACQGKLFFVNRMFKWSKVPPNVNAVDEEGNSILNNYLNNFINRMLKISSIITDFNEEISNTRGYDEVSEKLGTLKHMQKRYKGEYKAGREIASILINKGADLTYRNIQGELPLHQAVQLPGPEVARLMIKKKGIGYLTKQDPALLVRRAVGAGQSKTVRLLQKKNIFEGEMRSNQFSHLNWNNKSLSWDQSDNMFTSSFIDPILESHLDRMNGQESDLSWEEGVKIAFILIESANLTHRNARGELPLYKAIQLSDSRIAQRMIQVGGTKYLSYLDREILLSESVERGHGRVISFLQQDPFDPFPEKSFLRVAVDKCLKSFHSFSNYR